MTKTGAIREQTEMEKIRVGGMLFRVISDPEKALEYLQQVLLQWLETLKNAEPNEKAVRSFVQVVVPVASLAATIGLVVLALTGGAITLATALAIGFTILSLSLSLATRSESIFRCWFQTWEAVILPMKEEQARALIEEMQVHRVLPFIVRPHWDPLPDQKKTLEEIIEAIEKRFLDDLDDDDEDPIKSFVESVAINQQLREAVEKEIRKKGLEVDLNIASAYVLAEVVHRLQEGWLVPRLVKKELPSIDSLTQEEVVREFMTAKLKAVRPLEDHQINVDQYLKVVERNRQMSKGKQIL